MRMRLKTMNKLWQLTAVALVALLPLAASARRAQRSDEPFTEEFHQTYPLTPLHIVENPDAA